MSVKQGELIVGHIPRELFKNVWCFLRSRHGGRVTYVCGPAKSVMASYRFVGMIMMVLHGQGLKQNFFFVHTWCSNPFPRFFVYVEFKIRHL